MAHCRQIIKYYTQNNHIADACAFESLICASQVAALMGKKPEEVGLVKDDKETVLPDAATIADHEIEDDAVVYFVFDSEKPEVTPFGDVDGPASGSGS